MFRRNRIKITGLRYPVVITATHVKCHDRKETWEKWRTMKPEDIKSPNARAWWQEYSGVILGILDRLEAESNEFCGKVKWVGPPDQEKPCVKHKVRSYFYLYKLKARRYFRDIYAK